MTADNTNPAEIHDEVRRLAQERDAIILAHNYQRAEVQDVADFVGDSLGLSRKAAATDASVIVFAGVHFMAETAKILAPDKTVVMPEPRAGCPMADMLTSEQLRDWKAQHPGVPVVTYVNSTAAVKALTDVCCTSANAPAIVRSLGVERVLFGPDRNLAGWVAEEVPEVEVIPWQGWCPTHEEVTERALIQAELAHRGALVLVHPECRDGVRERGDAILSTSQMIEYAKSSSAEEFIVVTEAGLLHALRKAAPGKVFHNLTPPMVCPNMKVTTLQKVRDVLMHMDNVIDVPEDVASKALAAVERMVAVG